MKITGRDVKFFLLGVLTIFVINTIMHWEGTKESLKRGWTVILELKLKNNMKNYGE